MKVYTQLKHAAGPSSVALGFFDGVHIGHAAVISQAAAGKARGLSPAVFTFGQSPQAFLSGENPGRLMTDSMKERILEQLGVQALYIAEFCTLKDMSPQDFVKEILVERLCAKEIFCGFNFHFGAGGAGDAHTLEMIARGYGIPVKTVPPVLYSGVPVSSTRIRTALRQGDAESAGAMLGRPFSFDFTVAHGNRLGRKMETPTFNQPFPEGFILPRFGVYATAVEIGGALRCGVTNIGVKPTVGSACPLAETWLPDYECGELYGKQVEVRLLRFLRPEQKFSGVGELQRAIRRDGRTAQEVFASLREK